MSRVAALLALSAVIWFTLNDSIAITKSSSQSARFSEPELIAPPVPAPEPIIMAQAQTARAARRPQARKPRPQIRVSPIYPYRRYHAVNPLPYNIEYPGPRGVRHCVSRYVTEARPSGSVIVPRTRCWWTRG